MHIETMIYSQELVGQYVFTEKQLERFHRLHTTMKKCGIAFIVVAFATIPGIIQVPTFPNLAYRTGRLPQAISCNQTRYQGTATPFTARV